MTIIFSPEDTSNYCDEGRWTALQLEREVLEYVAYWHIVDPVMVIGADSMVLFYVDPIAQEVVSW